MYFCDELQLFISTGVNGVNTIDNNAFDDNLGADNIRVVNTTLGGAVSGNLTLSFSEAFAYDPTAGDLLIDMQFANQSGGAGSFQEHSNNGGIMSRAHNFGSGFDNRGLVTEFLLGDANPVPAPATWALVALGLLVVRRRRSLTGRAA